MAYYLKKKRGEKMKTIWTSGKESVPLVSKAAQESEIKHYCLQCKEDMGYQWILGPVCSKCCQKNHRQMTRR